MAEKNKKYYWLKLKNDFFKRHDIKVIEGMDNGKDYILFYLKLLVESVGHEGELRFSETIPYNEKMLATITNTNIDIVRQAIKIFTELALMEIFDDGTIYLQEVQKMIGHETKWAEKKRNYRYKAIETVEKVDNVLPMSDKRKSIEKELDIDKEIYINIVDYLNEKAGTKFKADIRKTRDLIKARLNEGFLDIDFFTVIDTKVKEWINNKEMKKYLRPETLFSNKFEGYLNQASEVKSEVINLPFIEED